MAKGVFSATRFAGGISDFDKEESPQDSHGFLFGLNHRKNPRYLTLLPKALKESGTVITGLPKWASTPGGGVDTNTYIYDEVGNLYKRTSAGVYSFLRTVPNSHGNGLGYFGDDDYLYYTSDTTIGRYGPLSVGTPQFSDDFLAAQGGVPQNTNSLSLVAASSQYASRADTASLSITGNLAIEAQIAPTTLPASGSSQVLVSKWDESGVLRSYKFEITGVSGYFGDGADGPLTISSDTTEAPIDSACTGTSGAYTLSATNASFAIDQIIFIHQSRGTGAGSWQRNKIISYTAGTITLESPLNTNYVSGAQVRVLKRYTTVAINSGKTYTAKAWDGTVGGILGFVAQSTITVTGSITASGKGFRGATSENYAGEGTAGASANTGTNNGNGGAAGNPSTSGDTYSASGGGAGGNGTVGADGNDGNGNPAKGIGGTASGSSDLTSMTFGGGSGAGGSESGNYVAGANGGGIIFLTGTDITVSGSIISGGNNGLNSTGADSGGSGGGAGGSILLKAQTATLGSSLITAPGGTGGNGGVGQTGTNGKGGTGSVGRIHIDYLTSYTGTTSPTIDATQDNNLVTNTTYQLRLHVSSTGSNEEILSKNVSVTTSSWQHVAVSWKASTSTATFFLNAISQGTSVGSLTAIHDNASTFQIGMSKNGAGSAANFYNGLIDEVRLWNVEKTADDLLYGLNTQIATNSTGLAGYWKLNGDYTDATSNANNLTSSGSPSFSSNVPFPSPSTRLDIDQEATTAGNTYTTPTSISEASTARLTFTPTKDPQKSIVVLIAAKGTGDWTLTVHDEQNRSIASKMVTNANLNTGYYEFVFASVWRPKPGVVYHFHVTSTVADGTVTTLTASDLETVSYRTYFQFLVEDTGYHPITEMLTFLCIGNEKYIGTLEAGDWNPNAISLSSGYKVRCFGYWQEYLVAGTWKGTTVKEYDQGRLYFWDGIDTRYNFNIDVPDGAVNAIVGSRGALYVLAGYQGQLLKYVGGTEAQPLIRMPRISESEYAEIYPQALTMWRNNLRIAMAGASDSTTLIKSVYTYGRPTNRYIESLSADYPISTGNYGTTVNISLLHVVNSTLLVGWQDGLSYGIDAVSASNPPQSYGTLESLIQDNNAVYKQKSAVTLQATFKPLLSGESIVIKYDPDRSGTWISSAPVTTVGATQVSAVLTGLRWQEIQYAVDLYTSGSTSPTLLGLTLEIDDQSDERRLGKI